MRTSRRRAREFALQGLYQWLLSRADPSVIAAQLKEEKAFAKVDGDYFHALLEGCVSQAQRLDDEIAPLLDRELVRLSPIEHAVLLLAAFELIHRPDIPFRVVINEAVELAKVYGGTDGHRYVNGVLDRLAARLRQQEAGPAS